MDIEFFPKNLNQSNIDRYIIRTAILKAIDWSLSTLNGDLLDIGCGKMPYKEYMMSNSQINNYVGLDIVEALVYDQKRRPDFTWDGKTMPFEDNRFDSAFATEVLEHCPDPEVVLKETFRVLKPGGVFFFTVPFLWNLHEVPHDEYRYTPFSLKRYLESSGFTDVEIYATGGWHLAMAQLMGLWVKRSYIPPFKRKIFLKLVRFAMKRLIKIAKYERIEFKEGQMITGLYGLAKKFP